MENNLIILNKYLKKNDIHIDIDELQYQLMSHPEFPSLLSYSDTLHFLNVDNSVYKIENEQIKFLPTEFIFYNDGNFTIEKKEKPSENFLKSEKIVLIANKSDSNNEKKQYSNISRYLMILLVGIAVLFLNTSYFLLNLIFIVFSLFGLFLAFEAYKKTHGKGTIIPIGVCKSKVLNTDCDYVYNTKKWKIFEYIDLSEISLTFFFIQTVSIVVLTLYGDLNFYYFIYYYFCFSFVPVSLMSLYYQIFVVKKLCPICIGIIVLIYGQFLSLILLRGHLDYNINWDSLVIFVVFAFVAIYLLLLARNKFNRDKKIREEYIGNLRFKRNFAFFKNNLNIQKKTIGNDSLHSFDFGNLSSNFALILVTSPFCKYCKEFYPDFLKLYDKYSDDILFRVVLDFDADNPMKTSTPIYEELTKIYINSEDKKVFLTALNEWYSVRNNNDKIIQWKNQYSNLFNKNSEAKSILENQEKWHKTNYVHYTPDIYINEYHYPTEYQRTELEYFISEMLVEN
ncbi:MAG: vitamin K epoxide reductase family protein [Flavobacteriaceae bacterium]|jgi:uncharacterized membrane protein|nr:vitamin K epoxide reductase family protein [Flavobacteriaceae bacterium]